MLIPIDTLFHVFAAGVLLGVGCLLLRWHPEIGVVLLAAVLVLGPDLRSPLLSLNLAAGGLNLEALDGLAVMMAGSILLGMRTAAGRTPVLLLLGFLGVLLAGNLLRGISVYGLQSAVNESRQWLYLLTTVAYGAMLPIRKGSRWRLIGVAICGWLVLVAAAGLSVTGLQPVTAPIEINGELMDPRPVTAAGALLLADGLLLVLGWRSRRRSLLAVAVLGGSLLLLQHRTVWLAAAAGLIYVMVAALRDGGRARLATVVGLGSVLLATAAAFVTGLAQRSAVAASAENVTAADNTFSWRVAGWRELMQGHTEPLKLVFGDPFGAGFRRVLAGQLVTVSPHSHYVETFLRFGLAGLGLSAVLILLAWRAAPAAAVTAGVPAAVLRGLLIVAAVYGITYRLDPLQGLLIGTLLGLASSPPPAPGPATARSRTALIGAGAP